MRATAAEPHRPLNSAHARRCQRCQAGLLEDSSTETTRRIASQEFVARVPAHRCLACGVFVVRRSEMAAFELAVAVRLVDTHSTSGEVLRYVRKVLGLKGKEMAGLLEVCAETVSRREQGKVPVDRATFAVLRQMVLERVRGESTTVEFLARSSGMVAAQAPAPRTEPLPAVTMLRR